jgi:hypothetical protein
MIKIDRFALLLEVISFCIVVTALHLVAKALVANNADLLVKPVDLWVRILLIFRSISLVGGGVAFVLAIHALLLFGAFGAVDLFSQGKVYYAYLASQCLVNILMIVIVVLGVTSALSVTITPTQ